MEAAQRHAAAAAQGLQVLPWVISRALPFRRESKEGIEGRTFASMLAMQAGKREEKSCPLTCVHAPWHAHVLHIQRHTIIII